MQLVPEVKNTKPRGKRHAIFQHLPGWHTTWTSTVKPMVKQWALEAERDLFVNLQKPDVQACQKIRQYVRDKLKEWDVTKNDKRLQTEANNYIAEKYKDPSCLHFSVGHGRWTGGGEFPVNGLAPKDIGWKGRIIVSESGPVFEIPDELTPQESARAGLAGDGVGASNRPNILGTGLSSVAAVARRLDVDPQAQEKLFACVSNPVNNDEDLGRAKHNAKISRLLPDDSELAPGPRVSVITEHKSHFISPNAYFGSLNQILPPAPKVLKDETLKLTIAKRVLAQIRAYEEQGIYLVDIKPENFVARDDGTIHPIDLEGAVRINANGPPDRPIGERSELGAPRYIETWSEGFKHPRLYAPDEPVDKDMLAAQDRYALGVMLFRIATGRMPVGDDFIQPLGDVHTLAHAAQMLMLSEPDSHAPWEDILQFPYFARGETYTNADLAAEFRKLKRVVS